MALFRNLGGGNTKILEQISTAKSGYTKMLILRHNDAEIASP